MKICVPVKWVVDAATPVWVADGGHHICTEHVQMTIDPLSQSALARAVALKTSRIAQSVVAVSVGNAHSIQALRMALAMGADTAVHVDMGMDSVTDTLTPAYVATALVQVVRTYNINMVLCGTHATDSDNGQTGARMASILHAPYVACATDIHITDKHLYITSVYDNMAVKYAYDIPSTIPIVVGCNTAVAQAKPAPLPRTLYVKNKPIDTIKIPPIPDMPQIRTVHLQSAWTWAQGAEIIDTQKLFNIITKGACA